MYHWIVNSLHSIVLLKCCPRPRKQQQYLSGMKCAGKNDGNMSVCVYTVRAILPATKITRSTELGVGIMQKKLHLSSNTSNYTTSTLLAHRGLVQDTLEDLIYQQRLPPNWRSSPLSTTFSPKMAAIFGVSQHFSIILAVYRYHFILS